ncbi:PhzF family phenazine biosynthesis isomerase [Actinomadura logoneensis]|uniref:PhzF family phenazine biosynthesis isomerase n=1 Tax=Actinomadura logoneensis TaxID=2293572 RepID=A0A372JBC7_9ACTN|nr:PhzF family phenazine biosynthesis isomerase [Actinomadura logoneensis]RFU37315.1 PhzF family phenazine biosynthesis isomerase [Actinomadura logoneensis]
MRLLVVDAFTERPFGGNPAGVCLLDAPADPAWMQRVAAELRHSETAFVRPLADPDADFELRWFTPLVEVNLCGHATLASAHALFSTGAASDGPLRFRTLHSGVLTVAPSPDGALEMDFPAAPPERTPEPDGLSAALGTAVVWTGRSAVGDVLAEVADAEAVRSLAPDAGALEKIDARGVIVTAAAEPGADHDFVSRFFGARGLGDGEDPVTGSAHCALSPFWSARLGRADLTGYQASERGGYVRTGLRGDRVVLTGRAVTVLDGTLLV